MRKLILILPLFLSGCLYINHDIGLTTYQYDKCEEYYDANGTYHKDCPYSVFDKAGSVTKDSFIMIRESVKKFASDSTDKSAKSSIRVKKRCVCSKSCIRSCILTRQECLRKCCHEKK